VTAWRSAYAEHYQRESASGEAYDRSVGNPCELAIFELARQHLLDLFRRLNGSDPSTRYLDFACGTGRILAVFRDRIRTMVGIDTSAGQLAAAARKAPDAQLVHGNLVAEPELLGDRQFDLITAFRLLLNLEPGNRVPILRALRGRLAPGGHLIVDNHMNRWSALGVMALLAHRVLRMPRKPHVPPGRRGIINTMSEREVRRALGDAGLEVVEVRRLFLVPGHGRARLLPTRPLVALEAALGRVPVLNRLSKNQIYVCRAAGEPPA
jgi:SAM-dependent methyltransferase